MRAAGLPGIVPQDDAPELLLPMIYFAALGLRAGGRHAGSEQGSCYFDLVSQGRIDEYMALLSEDFVLRGMGVPASGITHRMGKKELYATAQVCRTNNDHS